MFSKRAWNLLNVVATAAAGCILSAGQGLAASTDPPIKPDEGAVFWRWVGIADGGSCPPPPAQLGTGWSSRKLFKNASFKRCPDLEPFCVWEYDGSSGAVSAADKLCLDELDGVYEHSTEFRPGMPCHSPVIAEAEPDAMGLTPSGAALSSATWPELEQLFLEQAGKTSLPAYSSAPEVWLTLIDTSPTTGNLGPQENSPHGETLHLFARSLLCDRSTGDCVANIRTRLALGYTTFEPDDPAFGTRDESEGGYFGLLGELAEALVDELETWTASGADRLVMNLSIAWDRLYGGEGAVEDMPPNVQAVYRALECAACREDVLVVAAAGNLGDRHVANDHHQPLMPAAWTERVPIPSRTCDRPRPLVYAAGGFDGRRQPLANALESGMPEYAAYADHTVIDSGQGGPTPTLTGSSSSALVVSAAAAAAAYYAPALIADEVMDTLYLAGEQAANSPPADFCSYPWGATCPRTSYVSVCESAVKACQLGSCPAMLAQCAQRPHRRPDYSGVSLIPSAPRADFRTPTAHDPPADRPLCQDDLPLLTVDGIVDQPCPRRQYHALTRKPGSHPQPQSNLCPNCLYVPFAGSGTGKFYAEIEAASNEEVHSPILHLECGTAWKSYAVPFSPLHDGDTFVLEDLPGCKRARFSYTIHTTSGGGSALQGSMTVPIQVADGPM